ncbi:MAG: hypothetical protein B7Z71_00750, partial [Acidocella sp. 21-58-7]
ICIQFCGYFITYIKKWQFLLTFYTVQINHSRLARPTMFVLFGVTSQDPTPSACTREALLQSQRITRIPATPTGPTPDQC